MRDEEKTKAQLIEELARAREQIAGLEKPVSEHKQSEETEAQLRTVMDAAPISLLITRFSDGRIFYANEHLGRLCGVEKEDLIGRDVADFYRNPADREQLVQELKTKGMVQDMELAGRRGDGTPLWASVFARTLTYENEEAILAGFYDITDRKRTEQDLVRIERLRALGEMARGVAHNFNNILVGVLGFAQLIEAKTSDDDIIKDAQSIVKSALQAKDLVDRLNRAVQGEKGSALLPIKVEDQVDDAIETARPRWKDEKEAEGTAIQIQTDLRDVPPIRGSQQGLRDILISLILNAVDALPGGGSITISARSSGKSVLLSVADNGVGMDSETSRRVFEPFFTTKSDVGTGLGLSTVNGVVTSWGGTAEVVSKPGEGTTFTLQLPIWGDPEKDEGKVDGGRRRRVLIVEDDQSVCKVLSDLLRSDYDVDVFQESTDAAAEFLPGRYDVALIDLGMPDLPGDQVARKMREVDSAMVTVLVTGWELEEGDPRLVPFDLRILKPFGDLVTIQRMVGQAVELHDSRAGKSAQ